jgi:Zn-dependent protease with chaperone function
MNSYAWAQQAHLAMSAAGTLYLLQLLTLFAIYYRLHQKNVAARLSDWSAALVTVGSGNRHVRALASGILTALILSLPLALVSLACRFAAHAVYAHYKSTAPQWSGWVVRNYTSWLWVALVVVISGILYALLERLHSMSNAQEARAESAPRDNWFARTPPGAVAIRSWESFLRARHKAASFGLYHVWYYLVATCLGIVIMQVLMGANPLSGTDSSEPMPDSPQRRVILKVVESAHVSDVALQIRHVSGRTQQMNAWGTHKSKGGRIEFSDTYLEKQPDTALILTTGHELFHVLYEDGNMIWANIFLGLAVFTCAIIGFPKSARNVHRKRLTRIPLYVMLFVTLWPACQAVRYAITRQHEAYADMYGVQLTVGNHFITLEEAKAPLVKSHENNFTDPDPAWLFKILLYDHPSLVERLRNMDEAMRLINEVVQQELPESVQGRRQTD